MTTNEAMKFVAGEMKKSGASADEIAKMEIAIQYLGNPYFREKLEAYVFESTYNK